MAQEFSRQSTYDNICYVNIFDNLLVTTDSPIEMPVDNPCFVYKIGLWTTCENYLYRSKGLWNIFYIGPPTGVGVSPFIEIAF